MDRVWVPVTGSSNVEAFSYNLMSETMYVQYTGGKRYEYYKVPALVFLDLVVAKSKGKYLAAHVKGKFEYGQLLPAEPTPPCGICGGTGRMIVEIEENGHTLQGSQPCPHCDS